VTQIVIDAALRDKLQNLTKPLEFLDEQGQLLGRFTPASDLPAGPTEPWVAPPELLDWGRRQFSEEEIAAGLREVRQTGGLELRDFIHELEQAAGSDE
jgi:hypothetical protein